MPQNNKDKGARTKVGAILLKEAHEISSTLKALIKTKRGFLDNP